MKVAVFDTHRFERVRFERSNQELSAEARHELVFLEPRLTSSTARLAGGCEAVCSFVNDRIDAAAISILKEEGVRLIALRSAGFNHVDLGAAREAGIKVVRVPAYSPHAVAEHAVALILSLNRKIHRAYARVRELNFSLEGLVGFDLFGKTIGVVGTGKIGAVFARILSGFGCRILAYDLETDPELLQLPSLEYVELPTLYRESDIISFHVPLTPGTRHMVDARALDSMKPGVMLINTGRGALIDASALISALKCGKIGSAGLDVYEEEEKVFFQDLSDQVLQDDVLARLLTFPNVLITSHQAFLTDEALTQIARTTLGNITDFARGSELPNEVLPMS